MVGLARTACRRYGSADQARPLPMSTPPRPLPPKKDVALALLEGPSLYIHLDPRKPEVVVPAYFKKQPQLVLQVGLNMAIAIPDLKVDEQGITCTLSFNRSPFWCRVPWTAVYGLVDEDGKGMVWPDEVPAEVAAQRDPKAPRGPAAAPKPKGAREARKKLAAAKAPTEDTPPVTEPPQALRERTPRAEERPRSVGPTLAEPPSRPAPASPRVPEPGKPPGKRELPPYLRIVK
jgi:stringent starvation protein B